MRQLTLKARINGVAFISKLPMRQLTQSDRRCFAGYISKLPMRQLTKNGVMTAVYNNF